MFRWPIAPTKEWVAAKLRGEAHYFTLEAQLPGFVKAELTWLDRLMMKVWGWKDTP